MNSLAFGIFDDFLRDFDSDRSPYRRRKQATPFPSLSVTHISESNPQPPSPTPMFRLFKRDESGKIAAYHEVWVELKPRPSTAVS